MMTHKRNQELLDLFADATENLDSEAFTAQVLARTIRRKRTTIAAVAGLAVVMIALVWVFSTPLQEFSVLVAKGLASPLIELGDIRLSWLFAPVNNVASLLVLIVKLSRVAWKRMSGRQLSFY